MFRKSIIRLLFLKHFSLNFLTKHVSSKSIAKEFLIKQGEHKGDKNTKLKTSKVLFEKAKIYVFIGKNYLYNIMWKMFDALFRESKTKILSRRKFFVPCHTETV